MLGGKNLGDAGKEAAPIKDAADDARRWRTLWIILGVVFGVPILLGVLNAVGAITLTDKNVGTGFGYVLAATPVVLFVGLLAMKSWTIAERKQIIVIMVLFFGAAVFWSCFEQAGSTLNLFAQRHTSSSFLGFSFPASWFQSLNAIFVVAMAPVFAGLWVLLAKRGREPSSPLKFGIGMVLVGLGFLIMLPAVLSVGGNLLGGGERVSPGWLVSLYFVHTLAEMCISPVGLSSMTKLAPQRIAGMVMGIWFLAASVGNYMAGLAAAVTEHTMMKTFFVIMMVFPIVMALVLFGATRPIRRMMEATAPLPEARARD
jgi:POT family proton-dependent oligopeptide transporter